MGERLLNVQEVAGSIGCSVAAVRRWILLRKIGVIRLGRMVRVSQKEIDRLLAEGYTPAKPLRGNR